MKIIPISNDIKKDCREIYFSGQKRSGTYEIDPDGLGKFKVYCEMQASGNGKCEKFAKDCGPERIKVDDYLRKKLVNRP